MYIFINCVLSLIGRQANKLPSWTNEKNEHRKVINFTKTNCRIRNRNTHHSDETSKFGKKYYGYHISTQEGQFYSLGFRQIVTKSDQDTYSCFQQLLSDIEEVSTSSTNDTAKIL